MLGILGSGFGLYGYLPAAAGLGISPILLPEKYRSKFLARQELDKFNKNIHWVDSENELLESVTTLIIAKRPLDQFTELPNYLKYRQIRNIFLEKPLAPNPKAALEMLNLIKRSNKECCGGFIFRYTPWANNLHQLLTNSDSSRNEFWELKWHFMAHHFSNNISNWKRDNQQGGGVLRFYGIHIIALLAEWGYNNIVFSEIKCDPLSGDHLSWKSIFNGKDLPEFRIEIDSRSISTCFTISRQNDKTVFEDSSDPFDNSSDTKNKMLVDFRAKYLQQLMGEFINSSEHWPKQLLDITNLWALVEERTHFLD
jgi:hypothetical protein